MAAGRVVFDGAPETLTDHIARELYDLEANDVSGRGCGRTPHRSSPVTQLLDRAVSDASQLEFWSSACWWWKV